MYGRANKYQVARLKELAAEKFSSHCNSIWSTGHFIPAAKYAWTSTPNSDRALRDLVAATLAKHMELPNKAGVQSLLAEHRELTLDLLKLKADVPAWKPLLTAIP
jgi:hypothetical protein